MKYFFVKNSSYKFKLNDIISLSGQQFIVSSFVKVLEGSRIIILKPRNKYEIFFSKIKKYLLGF